LKEAAMPLMVEKPPQGIDKVLDAAVSELIGHGTLAMASKARPTVASPLRVFRLGADAIAQGKGLAAAEPVGWLATVMNESELLGTIELVPLKPARKGAAAPTGLRFGSFTRGPLQLSLAAAIARAAETAGRAAVEIAVLRAEALYLLALWLREKGVDRLVPIAPAPPPLKAGEAYPADRALALLAEAARAVLAGDGARN
jgi:hypothetical protein